MPTTKPTARETQDDIAVDALELLTADHEEVTQLFDDYEQLATSDADDETRQELAEQICMMLSVHAAIEEEIFYPAVRESIEDEDLVEEAENEHQQVRDLITQIQSADPADEDYDDQVRALAEAVEHHVREEEDEMFAKVRDSDMDLEEIGIELSDRKAELIAQMEDGDFDDDEDDSRS